MTLTFKLDLDESIRVNQICMSKGIEFKSYSFIHFRQTKRHLFTQCHVITLFSNVLFVLL